MQPVKGATTLLYETNAVPLATRTSRSHAYLFCFPHHNF